MERTVLPVRLVAAFNKEKSKALRRKVTEIYSEPFRSIIRVRRLAAFAENFADLFDKFKIKCYNNI